MSRFVAKPLLTLLVFAVLPLPAQGQVIICDPPPRPIPIPPYPLPRPRPHPPRHVPLLVEKHAIDTTITDGVAVTDIEQIFSNPYDVPIEGTYIFPLEEDAGVSKFSMYVNGQEVEGKLLSVEEARREYEQIVAKMRDPALLEYVGKKMFRARIFPIDPKGEARVKLSYTQMLHADDGLVRYRYPLDTEQHLAAPVKSVSAVVNIESAAPIKSVFSPTHKVAVNRLSDHKASASFEADNVYPDTDFELFYQLSDKEFGLTVLTYREPGQEGFFLVRIAPPAQPRTEDVIAKDIAFVVDTSGSMAGNKIEQLRKALTFCVSNLNPQDRFNIIPFSHEPTQFRTGLVTASAENREEATKFATELKSSGGTNINDALLTALDAAPDPDPQRPYLIVFMTDGLPTIGTTDPEEILKNVREKNNDRVRLFVFGIGDDVNTWLLDMLAEQNRGARDYVGTDEDLELKLSSFFKKVSDPVLADVQLAYGDLKVHDTFPAKLTDLFSGSELVVVGRYDGAGPRAVELTGMRRGTRERHVYETSFPDAATAHSFLPRLWATRKIGYLLDEIRLHGESKELKDTIVELATKYGIVTPYTAYLVTEPGGVAMRGGGRGRNLMEEALAGVRVQTSSAMTPVDGFDQRMYFIEGESADGAGGTPPPAMAERRARASGRGAVTASRDLGQMREARVLESHGFGPMFGVPEGEAGAAGDDAVVSPVAYVKNRTFYRVDDQWIDAGYQRDEETKKIELFSEEFFALLRKHPELAKCFALGEQVIVVVDGVAYETVPPPEPEPAEEEAAEESTEESEAP